MVVLQSQCRMIRQPCQKIDMHMRIKVARLVDVDRMLGQLPWQLPHCFSILAGTRIQTGQVERESSGWGRAWGTSRDARPVKWALAITSPEPLPGQNRPLLQGYASRFCRPFCSSIIVYDCNLILIHLLLKWTLSGLSWSLIWDARFRFIIRSSCFFSALNFLTKRDLLLGHLWQGFGKGVIELFLPATI